MVAHVLPKHRVAGSNPVSRSTLRVVVLDWQLPGRQRSHQRNNLRYSSPK